MVVVVVVVAVAVAVVVVVVVVVAAVAVVVVALVLLFDGFSAERRAAQWQHNGSTGRQAGSKARKHVSRQAVKQAVSR